MNGSFSLEAVNISKRFPGVLALDNFNFQLSHNEIHGLVGENGAGKSTFIKIINGLYPFESGEIYINGNKINKLTPIISGHLGIKFIHQELSVFPYISIMDNIFMNNYHTKYGGLIQWRTVYKTTEDLLKEYEIEATPKTKLKDLSIGQMQLIEIITAVSKNAKIIIMDEPTASLGDKEKDKLFLVMERLKKGGISIVFITHILEEVLSICDRTSVLRDGKKIGTYITKEIDRKFLIEKIIGEKIQEEINLVQKYVKKSHKNKSVAIEVKNLKYKKILNNINFKINYGEIIGILGLLGSGKSEIAQTCFGILKPDQGYITINDQKCNKLNPVVAIQKGIGFVTEDRHETGLFYHLSVLKNCSITVLKLLKNAINIINFKKEKIIVSEIIKKLSIKIASLKQAVRYLSGGNQQKVVLGRWLIGDQKILLLDEPTKGIDVGARSELYRILLTLRDEKKAIVLFTSDHREAYSVCERILILKNGIINSVIYQKETSPYELLQELTKNI